jgi:hypothetical protein
MEFFRRQIDIGERTLINSTGAINMKRAIILVLSVGFVLVSGCCASAQVVSDGGSMVAEDAKDSRLMQKVTLEEAGITLPDLMKKLTQQTGVSMSIDPKPEFWQIRERKVHLFVKDATLQEVQDRLKKLLNYSWKRTGTSGAWEYQLVQSEVDRLRESNLMAAWQKQVDEKRVQQTAQVIDKFQKAQLLTPEQAAQYKESDPWTYLLATWGPAQAWGQMVMNLPLSAITQINQGQGYSMSYQEMNPQMQAWMKELVAGVDLHPFDEIQQKGNHQRAQGKDECHEDEHSPPAAQASCFRINPDLLPIHPLVSTLSIRRQRRSSL